MNVAIYARSASEGEEGNVSIAFQIEMLRSQALLRGFGVAGEYIDRDSGLSLNRPGLQKLLADAERGDFEMVLIADFSRLSRSLVNLFYLQDLLLKYGVLINAKEAHHDG